MKLTLWQRVVTMVIVFPSLAFMCLGTSLAQSGGTPTSVLLRGRLLHFDTPPVQVDGRVLVPLRGVFEALNATVDFDKVTRHIFAARGETRVSLSLGSTQASVNGQSYTLDVPAQTRIGRTLVPLRFVSEALGAVVSWDAGQNVVSITDGPTASPLPTPTDPAVFPDNDGTRVSITGRVTDVKIRDRWLLVQSADSSQYTVRSNAALPASIAIGASVRVVGIMVKGTVVTTKEGLTLVVNPNVTRVTGVVTSITNTSLLRVTDNDGKSWIVDARVPLTTNIRVGDTVLVVGRWNGTSLWGSTVRRARATATVGQPVSFTGYIEKLNTTRHTLSIRGDNGELYNVSYARAGEFQNGDRVYVTGKFSNGVTVATSVSRR